MVTLFVKHEVGEYADWKRVYDEVQSMRKDGGVDEARVYRDTQQPNHVTVTHRFPDLDSATAFAASEELKSAMTRAGVAGPPEVWFAEEMEVTQF